MPGSGKTYLAKHLARVEFPSRNIKAVHIEVSRVVKQWIADNPDMGENILSTKLQSQSLYDALWHRISAYDSRKTVDVVVVSGAREPNLVICDDVARRRLVFYLEAEQSIRRQRYEKSGKWDFRQVERRAAELGTTSIAKHAACMFMDNFDVNFTSRVVANLADIYLFTKEK